MRRPGVACVLYLALVFCFSSYGEANPADAIHEATILEATDLYLDGRTTDAARTLTALASDLPPYWEARRLYLHGRLAVRTGDDDGAEDFFVRMFAVAEEKVSVSDRANSFALRAEARSRLMVLRGILYAIRYAARTESLARSALDENPENVLALLVLAQGKINAPRIFGGDVDFGIETLKKAFAIHDIEKGERFRCLYGLSKAWAKKKNYGTAIFFVDSALELYPGNPEAQGYRRDILAKLS